jgi:DNA-3-methyladenine glycosylase II
VIQPFAGVEKSFLHSGPYEEVRRWLLRIKGVGEWTADGVLLRGLGRMEQLHFAPGTAAERQMLAAITLAYAPGRDLNRREALDIAARYGSWQGYCAYYLRSAI